MIDSWVISRISLTANVIITVSNFLNDNREGYGKKQSWYTLQHHHLEILKKTTKFLSQKNRDSNPRHSRISTTTLRWRKRQRKHSDKKWQVIMSCMTWLRFWAGPPTSRSVLWPTEPAPIHWIMGLYIPGVKAAEVWSWPLSPAKCWG